MTPENSLNSFNSLKADEIMFEHFMRKFLQELSSEIELCFYPETLYAMLNINKRGFEE